VCFDLVCSFSFRDNNGFVLCHVISSPEVGVSQCSRIRSLLHYREMLLFEFLLDTVVNLHCMPAGFHVSLE
jgi:hypothetical protein